MTRDRARDFALIAGSVALIAVSGCGREDPLGPPEMRIGESICVECGMIISDARFATATIVEGPRGPDALLFDDFNCQALYEAAGSDVAPLARWVRDYGDMSWVAAERAHYVRAIRLRTPMASNCAAFAKRAAAEDFAADLGGELHTFESTRALLDGVESPGGSEPGQP